MFRVAPLVLVLASGCYLAHERTTQTDAAVVRIDSARPDAGAPRCARMIAGPSVSLDGPGGVTPRLVALDDGHVGVAYVTPGVGEPTTVHYEHLDAHLGRLTGPVLVARDSWTWAEPARMGVGLVVAFGAAADAPSQMQPIDLDGRATGARVPVALPHPEVLRATTEGAFWLAFDTSDDANVFVWDHVRADGSLVHEAERTLLGRYGSGFGVAARPDGSGHVVAYPSEGPSGVRRPRAHGIALDGTRTVEQTLSMDDADAAIPVFVRGTLAVVLRRPDALELIALDARTLHVLPGSERLPRMEGSLLADTFADRFVIGSFTAGTLTVIDGDDTEAAPIRMPAPSPGTGGSISWVTLPDAIVVAVGLVSGASATPWIARIECAD